jgi:hypothetical protein
MHRVLKLARLLDRTEKIIFNSLFTWTTTYNILLSFFFSSSFSIFLNLCSSISIEYVFIFIFYISCILWLCPSVFFSEIKLHMKRTFKTFCL